MKKLILIILLCGSLMTITNAIAKCDPADADNSSVSPVWNPNTGRRISDEFDFGFRRTCDKLHKSCSESADLLVTSNGRKKTERMMWIVRGWFVTELFVSGKNKSYQIRYWDKDSHEYCTTPIKPF